VTPLPERKKTAEELEELRANLGVPDQLPPDAPGVAPGSRERVELPKEKSKERMPVEELPPGAGLEGRERVELPKEKSREPTPADEAEAEAEVETPEESKSASPEPGAPNVPPPKPVRSLKRSEREPRKLPPRKSRTPENSDLPNRRHSDGELQRLRMQNAMEAKPPIERINAQCGHWALLALGYLLALAGGIGGIAVAAFLFFKKPRSTHHAAWMTMIAVLVFVFGILYFLSKTDGP